MADDAPPRVAVGVWAGWDMPAHFVGEGVVRMLCTLIEGAAESRRVVFRVAVRPVNEASARAAFAPLRATEGLDWSLHLIEDEGSLPPPAPAATPGAPARRGGVARLLAVPDRWIGLGLFAAGLATLPVVLLRALLRPAWRLAWRSGLRVSVAALRDPVAAAPEISVGLRRLRLPALRRLADGLLAWSAQRQRDRQHAAQAADAAPPPAPQRHDAAPAPAEPRWVVRGLDHAPPDAWLSLMPDLTIPSTVPGRRAMMLLDVMMLDFSAAWHPAALAPGGPLREWFPRVRRTEAASEAILTISAHVAQRQGVEALGFAARKMRVVPYAAPDLLHVFPAIGPDRRRSAASRRAAAGILRRHAAARGWDYLADFPLEHVRYLAVSTQERPSKNLPLVVEALRILLKERHDPFKLLMTTAILDDPAVPAFRLHRILPAEGLGLDALSVPRLPEPEHAAFFHAASLTVHPSFFEGGDTPLAFCESVSVGTPCLMARGPHTEEMLDAFPDLEPFVFDPYDAPGLADLIQRGAAEREAMLDAQMDAYLRMRRRGWAQVAEEYATAATGIPLVPVRRLAGADV